MDYFRKTVFLAAVIKLQTRDCKFLEVLWLENNILSFDTDKLVDSANDDETFSLNWRRSVCWLTIPDSEIRSIQIDWLFIENDILKVCKLGFE